jgi:organic radical activating enzyme
MYVEKVNQDKVKISACCVNTLGPETDTIDFDNDLYLQSQRELVKANKIVPGCDRCNSNSTTFSLRDAAVGQFRNTIVDINRPRFTKLDWNVDPTCNARCIQCSSHFSSAWAAEDALHGKIIKRVTNSTRHNSVSESMDVSQLRTLYFNGGEPMLSKEPLEFLRKIDQIGTISQLNLSLNTNGSIRPSQEFVELAARCKSLVVNFSIDGTGSAFEYIRNPLSWETVEQNICWWHEQNIPVVSFNVAFVLGVYNIDIAEDTYNWYKHMSQTYKKMSGFVIQPCYGILALDYTTAKLKQVWANKYIGDDYVHSTIRSIIEKSPNAQDNKGWQRHLEMIDSRRNLDWTTCLPKLHEAWKKSESL